MIIKLIDNPFILQILWKNKSRILHKIFWEKIKFSTIDLSLYLWLDNDGQIFVKLNFAIELINHKKRVINFVSLQLPR